MNKITTLCQAVASISYFSSRMNRSSQLGKRTSLPFAFTLVLTFLLSLVRVGDVWGQNFTVIGSGTNNSGTSYANPYNNGYWGNKTQQFITAAQLQAAGISANSVISQLGFNIVTAGTGSAANLNGFTVKVYSTTNNNPISSGFITSTLLATSAPVTLNVGTTGWKMTSFNGFIWDGSSNLVVETCFNNTTWAGSYAVVQWTNSGLGTAIWSRWFRADNSTVCSSASSTNTNSTSRPNIRFAFTPPPCTAPSTQASSLTFGIPGATSANVNWTNGNGGGRVVYINTTNSFTAPSDGTNPTATTAWVNTGQQCIFNGTGSGPVTVTGLSASTTYWVRVYEYCAPNRNYQTATATGNSNSFTTAAPSPTITTTGSIAFANQCANTTSTASSFTVSGQYLNNDIIIGAVTGYTYSTSANGSFTSSLTLTQASGSVPITTIFVKFTPTAATTYNGPIVVSSAGASSQNVTVSGTGLAVPIVNTGSDATICFGSSQSLAGSSDATAITGSVNSGTVTASGYDNTNYLTTYTFNGIPSGATITGITVNVTSAGGSYCPSWYSVTTWINGVQQGSAGCTGTTSYSNLNGQLANGLVISLKIQDNDSPDYTTVTFNATLNYSYFDHSWSPSTGLSSTTSLTPTASPTTTTTYTLTSTSGNGCSSSDQVQVTVLPLPTQTTVSTAGSYCNSTTLTAANGGSGTMYFQGTTSGGTSTATPSASQLITTSGTYYFRAYNGTCWGNEGSATVVINTQPVITLQPSSNSETKCQNTQSFTALSITATGTNLTYQWYSNTTASTSGGSLIAGATSASYTPSNATVGTLYYYCVVSSASCPSTTSGISGAMEVIGSPASPSVSAASTTINVGGSAIVTGTLGTTGNILAWYATATGGTAIALNNTPVDETIFNTANIPLNFCTPGTTATYYLEETNANNGCPSVRTPFTITTNAISTSSPTNLLICQTGGTVTMTANVVPDPSTPISWSSSSTGAAPWTNVTPATTPSILTVSPNATTHYQLAAITPMGCSNSITFPTFQVGVLNPLNFTPTATPSEVCVGETSALVSNTPSGTFSVASIPFAPATLPSSQSVNNIPAPPVGTYTTLSIGGAATTPLSGGGLDDGGWGGIPIGFDYNFFGSIFSSLGVGTNGLVMFGPIPGYGTGAGQLGQFSFQTTPTVFPNTGNPGNVIGLMLSDMRFSTDNGGNGILRYWNDGIAPTRRFILSGTYPQYSGGALTTVQLILYETSGIVEVHITSSAATIGRTVGLQDATKTIGALAPGWNNRTTTLTTSEAWRFTPPANYTFQWSTAGQAIAGATQSSYTTPTLTSAGTLTYNVAATNPTTQCATTQSVNITVNGIPNPPVAQNSTQCGPGVPTASVSSGNGSQNDNSYSWYTQNTINPSYLVSGVNNSGTLTTYYSNNFSSGTGIGVLSGDAALLNNNVRLTQNVGSLLGGFTVPASGNNSLEYRMNFDIVANLNVSQTSGADGMSYSFADDADATASSPNAEHGSGSKLVISFDEYGSAGSNGSAGIRVIYGGAISEPAEAVGGVVLAYSSNTSWVDAWVPVQVDINQQGQLTLMVNNSTIFSNVQLPSSFVSANKSTWKHVFKARTGGVSAAHRIDNIDIKELVVATSNLTQSVSSTTTYYVTQSVNGCQSATATPVTVTVNSVPAAPTVNPSTFTYCQGISATTLSATPAGSNTMSWYTGAVSGAGSSTAPTPSTATAGTTTYNVTQTDANNACVSPATAITVTVNATPSAPSCSNTYSTGTITQCQGSANISIAAAVDASVGGTLNYYTVPTGGSPLGSVPTTNGAVAATVVYYVSQTILGCEGPRTPVTVVVNPSVTPIVSVSTTSASTCAGSPYVFTATPTYGGTAPVYSWMLGSTAVGSNSSTFTYTDANDQGSNYGATWNNGSNLGTGFSPWAFNIGANTGAFIGNPANDGNGTSGIGTSAFGIYATGSGYFNALRSLSTPMMVGEELSFYWIFNWDAGGGNKGFDLKAGSTTVFNVNNTGSATITTSNGTAHTSYGTTPMLVTLTRTSANQYNFSMTSRSGGATYSTTINSTSAIDGVDFYIGGQNDGAGQRNLYFNHLRKTLAAGAQVSVNMTSNYANCLFTSSASSTPITMTGAPVTPSVSITQTTNTSICAGTSVTFSVLSGLNMGATPTYAWKVNGTTVGTGATYTTTSLVNGDVVTLSMTSSLNAACLSGSASATSNAITMTVTPATAITAQPTDASVCLGGSQDLSATAIGTGTITYQWQSSTTPTGTFSNISFASNSSSQSATLSVPSVSGQLSYQLVATSSCGSATSNVATISINQATVINTQPQTQTVCQDSPVTFSVGAIGTGTLSYQWRYNGAPITGATSASYTIPTLALSNAGTYSVVVTATCGSVTSANAQLTVTPLTTISLQPVGSTVCAGSPVNLSVTAAGTGNLTYQWMQNGTAVSGAISALYTIPTSLVSQSGSYTVEVTGGCSSLTSSAATVVVNTNTLITAQPVSYDGCAFTPTSVGVTAVGTNLTYAWSNGATAINNATSATYTLSNPQPVNSGSYTVTVSGTCGVEISNIALITINPLPSPGLIAGGTNGVCAGSTLALTNNVSGGVWTSNNTAIATVNSSTGVVTGVAAGNVTITYTVTNTFGCVNTTTTTIQVKALPTAVILPPPATQFCIGESMNLQASNAFGYLWSNGATTQTTTVSTSGNYTVTVTGNNGCVATSAPLTITVTPAPTVAAIQGSSNLCVGSSYNFTSATANGLWSSSNTSVLNVNTTSGLVTPTAAGTATITYNVANIPGCLNTTPGSASTTVTINTAPVAQITSAGATTFCQGGSVSLSANSGASYLWSNGATTQTISATSSGAYTVTVTNTNGCSTTSLPVAVTVNALPNANILPGANVNVCAGSSVMLSTGSAAAYAWSNGATTPTISVSAAGTFTVTLTGSNGCTATSAPTTVSVVSLPTAQITASGATSICQGSNVSLTATTGTGYSYLWSNGATTQTIAVGASGAYSVSVTNNGCTSTSQATSVNVVPVPSAQITASGPLTFCDGGSVSLSAPSGNGYTYVWSNGSISQQVSTAVSGTFSVVVSNSFGCTASSTPVSVNVNPLPAISALSGPSTICMGSQASLSHAVSGGIYSISNTAVAAIGQTSGAITPVAPGTALVTYTYSNAFGCSNSVQTNIIVNPTPIASATPSGATTFCQGGSVAISAPAALQTTYLWSNGSTQQNITATTSGAYNVVMTNSYGCSATSNSVNVTVNALPSTTVYPGAAVAICSGTSVTLSTSTAAAYQWNTGANTPTITVSNAGSYSATLTGSNGCTATTAPIVVTVNQTPLAQISSSGSTAICQGNAVTLTANSGAGYTYLWNTGATTPSISASSSGAYSVVVTNNGCSATSSATNITINPVPSAAITASGPLSFCDGGSVTLSAPAGNNYTYSWSNGATTQSVSTAQSASFTLTVSNAFGCSSTSTPAVVTVNPLPAQTPLIGSTTVCQGTAPTISHAISGGIFSTSNSTVLNVSTLSGTLTPGVTGSAVITYVYSNAFGCSNSVSQTFTVAPSPSAAIAQQGATTFCQGGSVTLLANAGTSYLWSNGATTQSISATTSGAYNVVISNSFGCSSTSNSIQVNVNPAPNATLYPGASVNICDGSSVTLSTGTAAAYLWSNGATSPTITVNQAGSYSVTLTGSNGCTSTSAVGVVTVTPVPVASITASGPTTICQGSSVMLTAAPATSYLWNNGATTQSITVSTVGSYFVNVGTGSCSATSAPVFVSYNPVPQAAITASGPTTFCVGGQVTLNATAGNGYTYLWSNGATTSSVTSSTAGTYAVTVTNAFGCSATSSYQAVAVNPLPTVTPITGASSLCANGQIQLANAMTGGIYTSSNLNAATIGNTSGVVSGTGAGTTTISYLYTDTNGCSNTVTYPISVLAAPLATISNSGATSFCQGGSVTLTAAPAASYLWSTGATTASIIASTAGSYSVTLTAANGCAATSAATAVTVNALPTVSILQGSAVSYCAGGSAQLSASPAASYLWSNGANTQTINVNAPGNYSVQVTSTNGCVATSTATAVTQIALPTALITASGPTTICQGNTVVLTASPASSYAWSNGATTQSITVLNAGSYTVQTSNGSCTASSAPVVVAFNPVPQAVVTASGPTTFCAGGQVTLSAPTGNGFTYLWSNGASTPTISSTTAGNYSVTVTNANGCSATSSPVAVTVNALPLVPAITGATSVCSNAQVQLSNTTTGGVYSSSNASVATIGNLSGLVTGQTPGTTIISYQVSNSNGCSNTVTYPITVLAAPTAALSNSGATSFCQGGSVTLTAGAASAYLWNTGQTTQSVTVSNTGNYAVTITAANGCSATTLPTSVAVLSLPTVNAIAGSNTVCSNGITTLTNSTSNGLWSSSNTAIATVNTSTGIVAGVAPGSADILYTVVGTNGCSATALKPMTVISPTAATVTAAGATTICQGSTVTLTASAASSYLWSNGATTQSITVAQSGPYNVQTTINGCTATSTNTVVTVVNPPVASISANGLTALCTGGSVTLTAAPASTYAWSTGATTQSITVSAAGSYTVAVSTGGCSATSAPTVVTLNATPSATISASGATSFCQGGSVTLSAPAATSYLWSNGANTQSITVSAAGSYSVNVSSNGCSATSSATAVSILPSPAAVITNTGSTTFCAGGSVVLNGPTAPTGSTFTYVWRLNGTPITGATATNYTASTAGTYSLVLTNNQGCSTTSGNTTVVVNALPTATITPSGSTTICAGGSLTLTAPAGAAYVWSNGANTQSIAVTTAGSYTVAVNANGCTATSAPTVVTVNALPTATITAAGSTTLCQGSSVVLTASPATSYLWSTGATSASITVANAGNYSVALTTNGCSATSAVTTVNVTPLPTPSVSVIGATTFCQGGSVTLTASTAGAYLWSNGATTQTIVVNTPGNYTVQATTNGCAATTAAIPVVVNALPTAGITAAGPTTFCQGGTVVLTAAAATSYLWSNGATTQSITVNTSGNFTVQATNANGCTASSATTVVSVQAPPAQPQIVVNGALALCPGSSVTLSAPTAANYLWTNGATTQSIVVSTPGNIGLTIGTAAGCTASAAPVSITALSAPTASITASGSTTICAGSAVLLTAAPATSYLWSNGATTQSISVQTAGSYTVQATSNGCSATSLPTLVQVNALPVASITASGPLTFCQGGSVTLSAAPATSYLWSNGATTQSITVQNAGTYDVSLAQNGCFAQSAPMQVVVQALPSVNVSASGPLTFCEGSNVTLTAAPANTYAWSNGATTQSITLNNSATLTLTSSNGVCSASSSPLNIQVLAAPALSANAGPNAVCVGSTIQLSNATSGGAWSAQDASIAAVNAATGEVSALSSGATNMTYTVVYPNGCSVAATSAISVNTIAPVSIAANGPLSFCNGSSVQLSLPAGFAYQWSTNQVGQQIVVNTAGTYSATVTNAAGCSVQVAPVQVTVFSSPALAIQASTPAICSGQSVNLTANLPAASYSWSNGSQNSSISVQQPGNYTLSIIDANGCSATALYNLGTGITPNASISAAGATNFCAGSSVTLNANNYPGGTYLWSTGATTQSITASTTGSYFVTVTSPSGCSAVSNALVLNVLSAPAASITVTGATTTCSNQTVSLAVSATGSYLWTNNAVSQSITPTTSGNYGVTVTGTNGCTTVVPPVAITILPAPVAQITASGPTTFCEGGSVNLLASGANTYVWTGNQTGAQISAAASGTYLVTATAANGCTDTEQIQVTVNPLPADFIVASGPLSFCEGESVVLSAAPGNTYLWSNGAQTSSVVIAASGTFDAVLTSPAGCVSNTNSLTVQVNQATSSTINATGGNDYLLNGILYTQSGTYTQVLTNAAGCDSTITLNLTLTVGVGENGALSFSVQPNPTDAIFTLKASEALFSNYVIQDAQGKVVATGTLNGTSTTINIDQVARGIYFLKVAEAAEAIRIVKN
jgi:hypothetical protein